MFHEHLFMCLLAIFEIMPTQVFCPFFIGLFAVLVLSCMSYFCILEVSVLLVISYLNIFSLSIVCLLLLFMVSFADQKFVSLVRKLS